MAYTIFILALALVVVLLILRLLRRRELREKYAAVWVVVAVATVVLALFPNLLQGAADLIGFEVGSNLLFLVAFILLLVISLQLSLEISKLEDDTRMLAEEAAISRLAVEQLQQRIEHLGQITAEQDPEHGQQPGASAPPREYRPTAES